MTGWWRRAHVGQRIVAVECGNLHDRRSFWSRFWNPPPRHCVTPGEIYTISRIGADNYEVGVGFGLAERDPVFSYSPLLFRPVEKRSTETGMRIFKELLNTKKIPEKVS